MGIAFLSRIPRDFAIRFNFVLHGKIKRESNKNRTARFHIVNKAEKSSTTCEDIWSDLPHGNPQNPLTIKKIAEEK